MAKADLLLERLSDYPLRKALVDVFGRSFVDEETTYLAKPDDLKKIYDTVNAMVFGNRLPTNVQFEIDPRNDQIAKGVTMFKMYDSKYAPTIKFLTDEQYDTMLSVANVVCHEMIHIWDILYGPISKLKDKTVNIRASRQFVGDYDAHGSTFTAWMEKIIKAGLPVSEYQMDKVKMKYFNQEDNLDEHERVPLAVAAKQLFDAIKTDELFLMDVVGDEVYLVMQ